MPMRQYAGPSSDIWRKLPELECLHPDVRKVTSPFSRVAKVCIVMPRTGFSTAANLSIELDTPGYTYRPGDVLKGSLKFKFLPTDKQTVLRAIRFTLWGRAKTKLIRKSNNGSHVYRGRANFFEVVIPLKKVDDPGFEAGDRQQTWQFDVAIPTSPSDSVTKGDKWKPDGLYLANTEDVSKHPLPPVFYYVGKSGLSGTKKEAYVEYVLTATATLAGSDPKIPMSTRTMTIPLMIRHVGTESPIQDFGISDRSSHVFVKSLALLPDKLDTDLTFRERMRTTFQPSKIPQFSCHFVVQYPRVLQLGNPKLPFRVLIRPRTDGNMTTIPISDYPSVRITAFSLVLKSDTHFRCQSTFSTADSEKSDEYVLYNSKTRSNGRAEIDITLSPDSSDAVDLGARLQLVMHRNRTSVLEGGKLVNNPDISSFHRQINSTFKTYNVAQTHSLVWKFTVEIVGTGKTSQIEGRSAITVLGECEEYIAVNEERKFDGRGVKKNYDDLEGYAEIGLNIVSQILQAVAG